MKRVESVQGEIASLLRAARENRAQESIKTEGAQEKAGVVFKAVGVDENLGVIRLVGASAGSPAKLDEDKEFFEKADVIRMAFDFCAKSDRKFNVNHDQDEPVNCQLVESWVGCPIIKSGSRTRLLKSDEPLTPDMDVVGINIEKGNETHWLLSVRPEDPKLFELAKAGGIVGASVGAFVNKVDV